MIYNQNNVNNKITGDIELIAADALRIVEVDTTQKTILIEITDKNGGLFAIDNEIPTALLKPKCAKLLIDGKTIEWSNKGLRDKNL